MRKTSISLATLIFLAACGGGGGDGDEQPPPMGGPLLITPANYETVAEVAVSSASYLFDSSEFVTAAQWTARPALAEVAWTQFARLPRLFATTPARATGAVISESMACTGSGSMNVTLNDVNGNSEMDVGESVTLVGINCVEEGVEINGTLGFEVKTLTGDLYGDVYNVAIDVNLGNFSATTGGSTVSGNGTMAMQVAATGVNASTLRIVVNSLTVAGNFGGISDTVSMQGYVLDQTLAPLGSGYVTSTSVSGVFASSALGSQSVTLSTLSPLVQTDLEANPTGGQFLATGLNGSKVRLTAQPDATNVLLELDSDGDSVFETSTVKAWSALN
jgi:hypothetical protein